MTKFWVVWKTRTKAKFRIFIWNWTLAFHILLKTEGQAIETTTQSWPNMKLNASTTCFCFRIASRVCFKLTIDKVLVFDLIPGFGLVILWGETEGVHAKANFRGVGWGNWGQCLLLLLRPCSVHPARDGYTPGTYKSSWNFVEIQG